MGHGGGRCFRWGVAASGGRRRRGSGEQSVLVPACRQLQCCRETIDIWQAEYCNRPTASQNDRERYHLGGIIAAAVFC